MPRYYLPAQPEESAIIIVAFLVTALPKEGETRGEDNCRKPQNKGRLRKSCILYSTQMKNCLSVQIDDKAM